MSVTLIMYYELDKYTKNGTISLLDSSIQLALLTKDYTPNYDTHNKWSDVSANEVAEGNGYVSGGVSITSLSVIRSGQVVTWSASNTQFAGLTKVFKYGVIYLNSTSNGVVKPLIALIDFDSTTTSSELTISNSTFVINWHEDGIWQFGPTSVMCV